MSLNTFKTNVVDGFVEQSDATVRRNILPAADLTAGTAVKLDSYDGIIKVVPIASSTDDIYGFVPFTSKRDLMDADGNPTIAVIENAVVIKTAGAALAVGAKVEIDPTTMKVVAQTTGSLFGTVLQASSADGDLIKIEFRK